MVAGTAGWLIAGVAPAAQQAPNPRQQPGAGVHIFAPDQHDLYDGHFVIAANRVHMVGGLNDPEGWDHLDNDATRVRPVTGSAEIDVDEIKNTGTFGAKLRIPEGDLVLTMDRWHEFSPCQHEHAGAPGVPALLRHGNHLGVVRPCSHADAAPFSARGAAGNTETTASRPTASCARGAASPRA